jgi:hypothetical protein
MDSAERLREIAADLESVYGDPPDVAHLRAGAEAIELLEWYGQNPLSVSYLIGVGCPSSWTWREAARSMAINRADDLTDALRKAKKASKHE